MREMTDYKQKVGSVALWGALLLGGAAVVVPGTPDLLLLSAGGAILAGGMYGVWRSELSDHLRESDNTVWRDHLPIILLTFVSLNLGAAKDRLDLMREDREKRIQIDTQLDAFETALSDLGMAGTLEPADRRAVAESLGDKVQSPADVQKTNVYPEAAKRVFDAEPQHRIEARLVVLFVREIDHEPSSVAKAAFRDEIDTVLSGCSFQPRDERANSVLTAYKWLWKERWEEETRGEVFEQTIPDDDEIERELLEDYTDRAVLQYLMANEEQAEEFRETLADLISNGKIDLAGVSHGVIEEKLDAVRDDIRKAETEASSYVVMSNQLMTAQDTHGAVEKLESKFPRTIRWKDRSVAGDDFPDLSYVSTRVCFTGSSYDSPSEFLDREIKPLLPPEEEWKDGAFVAVVPFETGELVSYPDKQAVKEQSNDRWEVRIENNFEAMNLLADSREALVSKIAVGDIRHEVDIDELLRVIPFNVVAPNLNRDEKHFIQSNYETLKDEFTEVNSLFDWAYVSEEALARELDNIDDEGVCDDWMTVAEDILQGIRDCAEAGMVKSTPTAD